MSGKPNAARAAEAAPGMSAVAIVALAVVAQISVRERVSGVRAVAPSD